MDYNKETRRIQERIYKILFIFLDKLKIFISWLKNFCRFIFLITVFLFVAAYIYYIGFDQSAESIENLRSTFRLILLVLFISKLLITVISAEERGIVSRIIRLVIILFILGVLASNFRLVDILNPFWSVFYGTPVVFASILVLILADSSAIFNLVSNVKIHPAIIFSVSFLLIITIGTGLLLLPKATVVMFTPLDALFTSVSAVCVTGLVVVDTATSFSDLGKIILLCLIQIGGLGIMTFTGFFSYIFTSRSTIHERLLLKELFSSESIGNLFKILTKIILFTFLTEAVGAVIIYTSLDPGISDKILFSAFHSVSAFCNAGFSTAQDGLISYGLNMNYILQGTIAVLIIFGGIGFPVLIKIYSYLKQVSIRLLTILRLRRARILRTGFGIEVRIVLITSFILIIAGTFLFYLFENSLSYTGMNTPRKIFVAFFNSVSARTAGFNVNDISQYSYPAIFLTILLMWIGASPGSTGGGIKTTTFAIALRTVWSNLRGRQVLDLSGREIGEGTINRVLSIIILSIIVIGTGFFCLLISEPGKNPTHLLFETVSAFATAGLSVADTSTFSQNGKIIIIILMFAGRIGPLTLLTGILTSKKKKYYKYPGAEIVIN